MKKFITKNKKIIGIVVLILILFSAFGLRYFFQINQGRIHFANDEARDILVVKDHILENKPILVGPLNALSVEINHNVYLAPFYYYLIAPALWIGNFTPESAIIFTILLAVLTTYLMYYAGREFFSPRAGIMAAALFATSAVLISYSWAWNPNPMPLFTVLYAIFLYFFIRKKTIWSWILMWLMVSLLTQLDQPAIIIIPITILVLLKFRPKIISYKHILVAIAVFLASYAPFIYYELTHHFTNFYGYIKLFHRGSGSQSVNLITNFQNKLVYIFQFFNRLVAGGYRELYFFSLVFATVLLIYNIKNRAKFFFSFFLIFSAFLVISYSFFKFDMSDHYLLYLAPLILLSIADFLDYLMTLSKPARVLSISLLILIIVLNLEMTWQEYKFIKFEMTDNSSVKTSFNNMKETADYIVNNANGEKFQLRFNQASLGYDSYVFDYILDRKGIKLNPESPLTYQIVESPVFTDYEIHGQILSENIIGKIKIIKFQQEVK